jgi:hypothetical protein
LTGRGRWSMVVRRNALPISAPSAICCCAALLFCVVRHCLEVDRPAVVLGDCEAHYYSGVARLRLEDPAAGQREFTAARDGCPQAFRKFQAAAADLKRLQSR